MPEYMGSYLPLEAGRYGRIKSSDFGDCLDTLRTSGPIGTMDVTVQTEMLMKDGPVFETVLFFQTARHSIDGTTKTTTSFKPAVPAEG